MKYKNSTLIIIVSLLLVAAIIIVAQNVISTSNNVTFQHIHGLDYSGDGQTIYVPAHDGLKFYKNGTWYDQTEGELHDYMGFSMFEGGFYSSGHPAPRSQMGDPFGIVKSTDSGKTLEILDLYEEVDFHGMAVGYRTREIYVFNPHPNSRMTEPGFYYTTDETETWNQSELKGLIGQPSSLAAHPTNEGVVAIGTNTGLYLSQDYGNSFISLLENMNVTAVSFDHGDSLLVGLPQGLISIKMDGSDQIDFTIPSLDSGDVITFVKQNPENENEYVYSTRNKDIFLSKDGGATWEMIVNQGVAEQ
ncbi:hypothetical protein J2S74_003789 [Evansella vedderi]|uniref:Glycosyl hydrolase n=1 Tax=Evansella vedderi TaxID=38282 RepID=A0ABT9ZYP0_9BACI|nr:hypothetical protein [Evansella vedderi]MDQ0256369.1 hypothetical protein [Evansella vedderi]